jgi:methylated-DNA-protein-cysteine methyltransferase-like protein
VETLTQPAQDHDVNTPHSTAVKQPRATADVSFSARVREVIAALEVGDVASYSEVAAWAGHPGAARAVGRVLAHSEGLPWWRVVNAAGRLTPGHEHTQARHLANENVAVHANRVVGFARTRGRGSPSLVSGDLRVAHTRAGRLRACRRSS